MDDGKGNVEFFLKRNTVKYNAIKKFRNNIIKIPSYILDEVFTNKMTIHIYHNGVYQRTFSYDNIFSYIKGTENVKYKGVFRQKNITYKLTRIELC